MDSSSIMAAAFVPKANRETLDMVPSLVLLEDRSVPTLFAAGNRIRQKLCPSTPLSPVDQPDLSQSTYSGRTLQVPVRYTKHHDLHFANGATKVQREAARQEADFQPIDDISLFCRRLEHALFEERKEILLRYERYTQVNAKVTVSAKSSDGTSHASFSITGITGARPAIQVGDTVLLRPIVPLNFRYEMHKEVVELQLTCLSVERRASGHDVVTISWLPQHASQRLQTIYHRSKPFHIRIVPKQDAQLHCMTALTWLTTLPSTFAETVIFPSEAPVVAPLSKELGNLSDLNAQQRGLIKTLVARTLCPDRINVRGPLICSGPAGVGKTRTLLSAILQVLSLEEPMRILVCAPSHTAADVITRRLSKFLSSKQLFRLYAADRPVASVPVPVLPYCCQSTETGGFDLPEVDVLLNYQVIVSTCLDANIMYHIGCTNQQLRCHRKVIEKTAISQLKLTGVAIKTIPGVDDPQFTHLFIDEAAQATEPESLIPLSVVLDPMPGNRKVEITLIGDPRQLNPEVYSSAAAAAGLDRSWMERLLLRPIGCLGGGGEALLGPEIVSIDDMVKYSFTRDGQEQLSFFLTTNYRGHPSFLVMPSALFYADKLRCASYDRAERNEDIASEWCQRLRNVEALAKNVFPSNSIRSCKLFDFPIHFRGVVGRDESNTVASGIITEESWTNPSEASAVVEIVQTLMNNAGVGSSSIGIIAPFRGQVVLIRKLLRSVGLASVDVGTIEDYQGQEREVMILSLTRSTKSLIPYDIDRRIGVFGQRQRSNVALTRAEQLQIVVGNPNVMATDRIWRQWLWFVLRNGLWYGEEGETGGSFWELAESLPVVRCLPQASNDTAMDDVVVVGTLEDILRGSR